ncbi:MAG: radical SAM protein [Candidatus Sulfobium sp.]
MMLLIHPPVAKPSEPPAGIARLAGMLARYGVEHAILDANLEGLLHLLGRSSPAEGTLDTWSKRAFRHRDRNLAALKSPGLYNNMDRYRRVVRDISRAIDQVSPPGISAGLVNYEDRDLSPVNSSDLLTAAGRPEINPFYPYFRARLYNLFRKREPAMVGVSLNYLSQALSAFSMMGFIKRDFPAVKIVLGGGLVTSWMSNPEWHSPFGGLVDHLVAGAGETRLPALLGLHVHEGETALPAYGFFPREGYLSPGFILPYSASTGCYWSRCSFCPEQAEGNPYLPLPTSRVTAELRGLAEETDPVLVHLLDNAISPSLLDAIIADNMPFPWYGFARIGPRLADLDFCVALRKAGCVMLKLGIESGDQDVLDEMRKGISVQTASVALKNLNRAGIAAYVYLIFGTPAETEASARKTLEFTVKHHRFIDFLNLAVFNMPLCGKKDHKIKTRKFYDGDLSLYTDFVHPKGWNRRRVRIFLESEFKKHPAVSAILKNDPPSFTSNHAPFFVTPHRTRWVGSVNDKIKSG